MFAFILSMILGLTTGIVAGSAAVNAAAAPSTAVPPAAPTNGTPAPADLGPQPAPDEGASVGILNQVIFPGTLAPLLAWLAAAPDGSTVDLLINSPGGAVDEMNKLINSIRAAQYREVHVNCYVYGSSISAAFWILSVCSERHALANTTLMFHRVREQMPQGQIVTAVTATKMAKEMLMLDELMEADISIKTEAPDRLIWKNLNLETMWTPAALWKELPGFLTDYYPVYPGLFQALDDKRSVRQSSPNVLQMFFGGAPGPGQPAPAGAPTLWLGFAQ